MANDRIAEAGYRQIADELSLDVSEVRQAVRSYFDAIALEAKKLPFDNEKRIYSKEKFEGYIHAHNVPGIGRIGPVYSRYLKWRANEAKLIDQVPRSNYKPRLTEEDIERLARQALKGEALVLPEKKKPSELYERVWLVGQDGRKLARQVIPKDKNLK